LIIGTFGRAAWVLDDIRPLRAMAKNNKTLAKKMELFNPPTAYLASYQQATGSRFGGDALYNGENRRRGAPISFSINKPKNKKSKTKKAKKEDKKTVKYDSIKLEIFDGTRLIRTLKRKTPKANGIHKIYWYLREKGVARPSRSIRKSKREPGGVTVKPGVYTLKMTFGNETAEQQITVKTDPRLKYNSSDINEKYTAAKELETYQKKMATAVKQLVESKKIVKNFKSKLSKKDKKLYKEEIKLSLKMNKKIDSLISIYIGKIDKRQGITRNPETTIMQRFGVANWYTNSRFGKQTSTEKQLVSQFKTALKDALQQTNTFFNTDWKAYQQKVEKIKISPFKEIKRFLIE